MSGECTYMELDQESLKSIPSSNNYQAIIGDEARALINIPMGKIDQLSRSARQY